MAPFSLRLQQGSGAATSITVNTTAITGGTDTRVLFDDGGFVGENAAFTFVKGSGTLSVTNLVATGLTQGSVLFAGSAGAITQDNANFFWDDTNNRLGIGTATPDVKLHVSGGSSYRGFGAVVASLVGNGGTLLWETTEGSGTGIAIANVSGAMQVFTDLSGAGFVKKFELEAATGNAILSTPSVVSSGAASAFTLTAAAHTGQTASTEVIGVNFNLSRTLQHATGALTTQREFVIQAPTYSFVGASTITTAATFAITGAPVAGTNATITNKFAFWVQAGTTNFDGLVVARGATAGVSSSLNVNDIVMGTSSSIFFGDSFSFGGSVLNGTTSTATFSMGGQTIASFRSTASGAGVLIGNCMIVNSLVNGGASSILVVNGAANTGLTASTEVIDVNYNLARTVQFNTGALALQRAYVIGNPTYAFVGASTITTAATAFTSNPAAGTNCTITASWGWQIGADVAGGPTSAGQKYASLNTKAHTTTVTGSTQVTQAGSFSQIRLDQLTITDASAVTIDSSATLYIAGANIAAGSVTLTENHAIFVDSGTVRFDGQIKFGDSALFQTTVGAAGAGSALPATPTKYAKITDNNGTTFVFPVYAAS